MHVFSHCNAMFNCSDEGVKGPIYLAFICIDVMLDIVYFEYCLLHLKFKGFFFFPKFHDIVNVAECSAS